VLGVAALLLLAVTGAFFGLLFYSGDGERGRHDPAPRARAGADDGAATAAPAGPLQPARTLLPPAPPPAPLALTATMLASGPPAPGTAHPSAAVRTRAPARPAPAPRRKAPAPAAPATALAESAPAPEEPREDPLNIGMAMTTESIRDSAALFRPARWIWSGAFGARTVSVTLTLYDFIARDGGDAGEMLIVQDQDECSWEGLSDLWASFDDARIRFKGGGNLDATRARCADVPPERLSIECDRPSAEALAAAPTLPRLTCRITREAGSALAALFQPR